MAIVTRWADCWDGDDLDIISGVMREGDLWASSMPKGQDLAVIVFAEGEPTGVALLGKISRHEWWLSLHIKESPAVDEIRAFFDDVGWEDIVKAGCDRLEMGWYGSLRANCLDAAFALGFSGLNSTADGFHRMSQSVMLDIQGAVVAGKIRITEGHRRAEWCGELRPMSVNARALLICLARKLGQTVPSRDIPLPDASLPGLAHDILQAIPELTHKGIVHVKHRGWMLSRDFARGQFSAEVRP